MQRGVRSSQIPLFLRSWSAFLFSLCLCYFPATVTAIIWLREARGEEQSDSERGRELLPRVQGTMGRLHHRVLECKISCPIKTCTRTQREKERERERCLALASLECPFVSQCRVKNDSSFSPSLFCSLSFSSLQIELSFGGSEGSNTRKECARSVYSQLNPLHFLFHVNLFMWPYFTSVH